MTQPQIRYPVGDPRLAEWNRNIERAIADASAGVEYAIGSGGTVTQATSKATAVTLDRMTGEITLNTAALAAATIVSFTLNNAFLEAGWMLATAHHSGGTIGAYTINGRVTGAGTAEITIRNNTAGSLAEAVVVKFAAIAAVTA
jgi:hypothetical protein